MERRGTGSGHLSNSRWRCLRHLVCLAARELLKGGSLRIWDLERSGKQAQHVGRGPALVRLDLADHRRRTAGKLPELLLREMQRLALALEPAAEGKFLNVHALSMQLVATILRACETCAAIVPRLAVQSSRPTLARASVPRYTSDDRMLVMECG